MLLKRNYNSPFLWTPLNYFALLILQEKKCTKMIYFKICFLVMSFQPMVWTLQVSWVSSQKTELIPCPKFFQGIFKNFRLFYDLLFYIEYLLYERFFSYDLSFLTCMTFPFLWAYLIHDIFLNDRPFYITFHSIWHLKAAL